MTKRIASAQNLVLIDWKKYRLLDHHLGDALV
jgi:hypothetical protein